MNATSALHLLIPYLEIAHVELCLAWLYLGKEAPHDIEGYKPFYHEHVS